MNEIYVQMSQNLEKKLMTLKDTNEDVLFVIEKAIGLCTLVLHKMKELVSEKDFTDKASEIHFFKHIKPRVYAKLVFYLKLLKIETHRPLFPQENQLNKVNPRKEFFRIGLKEIKEEIESQKIEAKVDIEG